MTDQGNNDLVEKLRQNISALRDPAYASAKAVSILTRASAARAAEAVEMILKETPQSRQSDLAEVLIAITDAVNRDLWPQDHLKKTRSMALQKDLRLSLRFLAARDESATGQEDMERLPPYSDDRTMTLGERKSLARNPSRHMISLAARDPDPSVMRILLSNPRLTEEDVVRIAASRDSRPRILKEVACSSKWLLRYRVCIALVRNPLTPLDVSLRLISRLRPDELRRTASDGNLNPSLIRAVEELLRIRSKD